MEFIQQDGAFKAYLLYKASDSKLGSHMNNKAV